MESEDIQVHFTMAIAFIDKALANGSGILVHCQAGISEKVSLYVLFHSFPTYNNYFRQEHHCRSCISYANPPPNPWRRTFFN
jgi:hypothetical protein